MFATFNKRREMLHFALFTSVYGYLERLLNGIHGEVDSERELTWYKIYIICNINRYKQWKSYL